MLSKYLRGAVHCAPTMPALMPRADVRHHRRGPALARRDCAAARGVLGDGPPRLADGRALPPRRVGGRCPGRSGVPRLPPRCVGGRGRGRSGQRKLAALAGGISSTRAWQVRASARRPRGTRRSCASRWSPRASRRCLSPRAARADALTRRTDDLRKRRHHKYIDKKT
jgi:hypothetical protein